MPPSSRTVPVSKPASRPHTPSRITRFPTERFPIGPVLILALLVGVIAPALCSSSPTALHRERIEWCDFWHTDADKSDRPRVLMIGDSIARGYFGGVETALGDRAYCSRFTTSRSVCDPVFFQELELALGQYPYAVVHFNNGLHGWDYTESEYAEGFDRMLATLREKAPGARLIWATTTPVREDGGMGGHRERVAARNALAAERVAREGIPTDDLHAIADAHPEHLGGDGVHFTDAGRTAQAEAVAEVVRKGLGERGE